MAQRRKVFTGHRGYFNSLKHQASPGCCGSSNKSLVSVLILEAKAHCTSTDIKHLVLIYHTHVEVLSYFSAHMPEPPGLLPEQSPQWTPQNAPKPVECCSCSSQTGTTP